MKPIDHLRVLAGRGPSRLDSLPLPIVCALDEEGWIEIQFWGMGNADLLGIGPFGSPKREPQRFGDIRDLYAEVSENRPHLVRVSAGGVAALAMADPDAAERKAAVLPAPKAGVPDPAIWISSSDMKDKCGVTPAALRAKARRAKWKTKTCDHLRFYRRADVRKVVRWQTEGI